MQFRQGATRNVFLVGRWAIKIPRLIQWNLFLLGLLGNMNEVIFWKTKDKRLCPVLWSLPCGFFLVMARAKDFPRSWWDTFDVDAFLKGSDFILPIIEHKMDSFGVLNGNIVAVDYGGSR